MKIKLILSALLLISGITNAQTCLDYIPNEWQDSRYINNHNGTVTDTVTNLMWKQCSEGQTYSSPDTCTGSATGMNWQEALNTAGTAFTGKIDWRLPNIKELASLIAANCHNPSINQTLFPNTPSDNFSSSTFIFQYSSDTRKVNFSNGQVDHGFGRPNIKAYRVRLVRPRE